MEKITKVTLLLALPEITSYCLKKQARVLVSIFKYHSIDGKKLGWFLLENASNNDTALEIFACFIFFTPPPLKKTPLCRSFN